MYCIVLQCVLLVHESHSNYPPHGLRMIPNPSLISLKMFKYIKFKENKKNKKTKKKVTLLPALVYQNSQYLRKMRNRKTTTAMAALAASEDRRLR